MSLRVTLPIVCIFAIGFVLWHAGWRSVRGEFAELVIDETGYSESPTAATSPTATTTSTQSVHVPILVYHIVRPAYPTDSPAVRAFALTPETFDAELSHLTEAGYHIIGLNDLAAHFASGAPLPAKPIVLTFDDGWRDQFDYAFPVLQKHRMTATFFVFTNAMGHRGFMSWENLRALIAAGMTVGDHSRSHPYLLRIANRARLWSEIDGSKKLLEGRLGAPVTAFAYPFGQYDSAVVDVVKKVGFASARGDYWTGGIQTSDRLYELNALNAPTTLERFAKRFP